MGFSERMVRSIYKRIYELLSTISGPKILNKYLLWGVASSNTSVQNFSKSKLVIIRQELKALSSRISPEQRISLWWAVKPLPGNLGDSLNPHLIEFLTRIPPLRCKEGEGMMVIGSTIERASMGCVVWGSGLISRSSEFSVDCDYRAVRGPFTRERLVEAGAICPEIYGDPAILLPLFIQPKTGLSRTKIGVIPHYQHQHYSFDGVDEVISVDRATLEDFQQFVDHIGECSFVFSSSLHGLILCRAYQIPCARIIFDRDMLSGDDIKFADYRLGVGLSNSKFIEVNYDPAIRWDSELVNSLPADEPFADFDIAPLLDSFPYPDLLEENPALKHKTVKV